MPALPAPLAQEARDKLEALFAAARKAGVNLCVTDNLTEECLGVLACSDFVARTGQRYPQVLADLLDSGDLLQRYPEGTYQDRLEAGLSVNAHEADFTALENDLGRLLRQLRCREMVRIAWRDLAGRADLGETIHNLSALADACIEASLNILYDGLCQQLGAPTSPAGMTQRLVVIGMGKLGAGELNFSSDVDLIFAFPEAGRTQGAAAKAISNDEFFLRLCRSLVRVLGQVTDEGFVFRIDTNLRPYGESGPLVMSFAAMESYYQAQGREWERYAWIKARVVAGDARSGRDLLTMLHPFVYRRYLDYGVFESLREM